MKTYRIDAPEQIFCDLFLEGKHMASPPSITVVFKEKVNLKALTYAVEETMAFHPYFATRLFKEGSMFYWQENNRKPIILEKQISEDLIFGYKTNNYLPWVITFYENTITFSFSHELTDAGGASIFLATAVEYYARYLCRDMSKIVEKTNREQRLKSEAILSSEVAYREGVQAIYTPKDEPWSKICPEKVGKQVNAKLVSIDTKMLREKSFSYGASPFSLVAPILARACIPYLEGDNKIVKLMIPQNVRKYFDSQTLHNLCKTNNFYYYDNKMRNKPMDLIATIFRGRLDLLSDRSNIEAFFTSFNEIGRYLDVPQVREKLRQSVEQRLYDQPTIAYTHMTENKISPYASEHIANVYFQATDSDEYSSIVCTGWNFGDTVNLTISTWFMDGGFFESIQEQFDELGVKCSVQDIAPVRNRYFDFIEDTDE